jgi:hypothetical protein
MRQRASEGLRRFVRSASGELVVYGVHGTPKKVPPVSGGPPSMQGANVIWHSFSTLWLACSRQSPASSFDQYGRMPPLQAVNATAAMDRTKHLVNSLIRRCPVGERRPDPASGIGKTPSSMRSVRASKHDPSGSKPPHPRRFRSLPQRPNRRPHRSFERFASRQRTGSQR